MIGHVATLSPDSPASFSSGPLPDAQDSSTDQINVDPIEPISSSGQDIISSSNPDGTGLQSWKDLIDSILDSKVDNATNDQSSTTPLLQFAQPQFNSPSRPDINIDSLSHVTPAPRLPAIALTDLSEWIDFSIPEIPCPEVDHTNQHSKIPTGGPRWKTPPPQWAAPHIAPSSSDPLPVSKLPLEFQSPSTPLTHPVSLPASVPSEYLRLPDRTSAPEMINRGAIPVSVLNKMLESSNDDIFAAAGGVPALQGLLEKAPPKGDVKRLLRNTDNLISAALDRTTVDVSHSLNEDETHSCRCVVQ